MFFWPGVAALWGALFAGLASLVLYLRVDRGRADLLPLARQLYAAYAVGILAASAILMTLLLQHRFDVGYVNAYSSRDLPFHYLFSSFWGGQEGSFLLWLFWGALIGFPLLRSAREQEAPVMIVYLASFLGIVAILCKQSPFKILPPPVPQDGVGLNPLLQDPWMVIHPPVMFIGFASLSVPFAFAIAALWKRRWDGWVTRATPWALTSFVTLGTAILMGGYWAYKTLGWGGYWGWDPVENTSLVPWLFTVALVHGMFLQRSRRRHRKINLILACLAYLTILYGTFLTRSGILADFSVHSFVDLGITGWLVAILLGFLALSVGAIAWRWRQVPVAEEQEPPLLSRSVLFVLGIAAVVALGLVILLGTSAPLLTRLSANPSQVQISFYTVTATPAAILLLVLAGLVPFVAWKGTPGGELLRSMRRSMIVGLAVVALAFALGARDGVPLLLLFLAFFSADMNLRAVLRKIGNGKMAGAGGYLAHVGVGILLAGAVVSGVYEVTKKVNLPVGVPVKVDDTTLTFLRVVPATATRKQAMEVRVESASGKRWMAYPKMYVNTRTNQLMANPDIRSTPVADYYMTPQAYDPGQPERRGLEVRLAKGTTQEVEGVAFTFDDFQADRAAMMRGEKKILVLSDLIVVPADGARHDVQLRYEFFLDGREAIAEEKEIPGVAGSRMRVVAVSPNDGAVVLNLQGIAKDPKRETQAATQESLAIEVTDKPLISLVWAGFYVMMAGAAMALVKRAKEARRAVLSGEPEPSREPVEAAAAATPIVGEA
jgi:cytochrome c-type biogenesis protein CcmF